MEDKEANINDPSVGANRDRREYGRVAAECPMMYRIIHSNEEGFQENQLYRVPSVPFLEIGEKIYAQQEQTDQILELLLWLDLKVSFLIKNLQAGKEKDLFPDQGMIIDISVSGMKFRTAKRLDAGTRLVSEFVLPTIPFREMFLACEVIRSYPAKKPARSGAEYDVCVKFEGVKEPEREQIIRYVVKRQMQLQRERQDR